MLTQNMDNGLDLYLGSQPICIVGFEFPTMGSPLFGDPVAFTCLHKFFSFFHKIAPFTLDMATSFPLFFSPESPPFFLRLPPFFPFVSLRVFQPPFLLLFSYLYLKISGGVMIILDY